MNRSKVSFISVGSLLHVKGYDFLIKTFSLISKDLPPWELNLIGGGEEYEHLKQMIIDYGLSDYIKLIGRKGRQEIVHLLGESDVYISSSRSENFSVSVIEALSLGVPIIATVCGGIKECIDESNGLLVPVEDEKEMAKAIMTMSNTLDTYNRNEIAEQSRSLYAPQVIAQQLTNIFEEVINK